MQRRALAGELVEECLVGGDESATGSPRSFLSARPHHDPANAVGGVIVGLREDQASGVIEKIKARPNPGLHLLGVVVTLHDKRTVIGRDVYRQISQVFGDRVFKTTISKSVRLEESPAHRESIFTFAPRSAGAAEYYSLSEEVLSRV